MSTYAIGDIQGCFEPFMELLNRIDFKPKHDTLWLTGDLVNRGPDSLSVLRFVIDLPKPPIVVLGNHDLHLLAVYSGQAKLRPSDTLQSLLDAPDSAMLCHWLQQQPLVHLERGYTLLHAGLPPQWTSAQAKCYAGEVEAVLKGDDPSAFFAAMYGQGPTFWQANLEGFERLRFIVNVLTRIRFCTQKGELDFAYKGIVGAQPAGFYPWFEIPHRASRNEDIIFGHWAALQGKATVPHVFPLDTGCVWGNCLTAMRLEDRQFFQVDCRK